MRLPGLLAVVLVSTACATTPPPLAKSTRQITTAAAAIATAPAAPLPPRKIVAFEGVTEYALDNGLRVLLVPDRALPTVTVSIHYNAGSAVEGSGEAGLAHLFEHMLFKGTTTRDNLWAELERHGAQMNGYTWVDSTQFFETLPASEENLAFAVDLEADRMVHSRLLQADLDKEFSVVRNEFEMTDSNPLRILRERMLSTAYRFHGYGRPTLGSKSDIEKVPVERLREFYRRWYRPDNATLVIGGRFDAARALAIVGKSFGGLQRPSTPLPAQYSVEPPQDGDREVVVRRGGDVGFVGLVYHGVAASADDYAAEMALGDILTRKPTGRLYRGLVGSGLAASIEGTVWPWSGPGALQCFARVRKDQSLERARTRMVELVEKLGDVDADEVERFKRRALKQIQFEIMDANWLSQDLGEWAVRGDWRLFYLLRDRIAALTAAQVNAFASNHLKPANRTAGLFVPTAKIDAAPLAERPRVAPMVQSYAREDAASEGEAFEATLPAIERRLQRSQLAVGTKLALLPKATRGHAVRLVVDLPFGSADDLRGKRAALELLPQMLLRGTRRHTRAQLEDEWDRLQAHATVDDPDVNEVRLVVTTVRAMVPQVIALVAEIVKQPAFDAAELELYRKERLAELEERLQTPMSRSWNEIMGRVDPWPADDLRHVATYAERIAATKLVKAGELADIQRALWGASDAMVALVGDFDAAEARKVLEREFGSWKSPRPYRPIARPYQATRPSSESIRIADKSVAYLTVGQALDVRDDDPDYAALVLANYVLGGGMKSRLVARLREKEGLSYGTSAYISADRRDRRGSLLAWAMCATQNVDKALRGLREEIARLVERGIPQAELDEAKKSYRLQLEDNLASDEFVAGAVVDELTAGRNLEVWLRRNQRIEALTSADVQTAMAAHLRPSDFAAVQAGDFKP
ncbi:MAG: pqqL5 [bacterium]|nr:pqqL5 [bacterium]